MILTGVAVGVQTLIPATKTPASLAVQAAPESQTAAINGMAPLEMVSDSQAAGVAGVLAQEDAVLQDAALRNQTSGGSNSMSLLPSAQRKPLKAGYDVVLFLYPTDNNNTPKEKYFPVCPTPPKAQGPQLTRFVNEINKKFNNSGFGKPTNDRCQRATVGGVSGLVPRYNNANWPQWTVYCQVSNLVPGSSAPGDFPRASDIQPAASAFALVDPDEITDVELVTFEENIRRIDQFNCRLFPPGSGTQVSPDQRTVSDGELKGIADKISTEQDAVRRAELVQDLSPADTRALNSALSEKQIELGGQLNTVQSERNELEKEISKLAGHCAGAGVSCDQEINDLSTKKAELDTREKELQAKLKNLSDGRVDLNSNSNCTPGTQNCANVPDVICRTNPQAPGCSRWVNSDPGVFNKDIAEGIRNNTFNGNNVPSPFGGPCTTGYVCSGNTLYYQSPGNYSSNYGECRAMPMQQCPYGCQQPYGALQGQQGGTQNTLGGIMAGMQIFSAISSMFGGGNSSSMTANPNLSRQCALSPQMQQQQNPYGTGNNGQACRQPQTPQPDPAQCSSGSWRAASQNGCFAGWQCVPDGSAGANQPTAQLSCQPQVADVGMPISFSFSCGNSNGSAGTGFDTNGALSGNASSTVPAPPAGQNTATYALTCIKLGVTASAQCQVQIGRPGIVMVTNPKSVKGGETSLIGWVTSGMKSCTISSPDQQDFTSRNAGITLTSGAASTSPIVTASRFRLDCETLGGDTRQSETTITLAP
jgi:hypothetical protein